MHRFKLQIGSTVAERLEVLKAELETLAGGKKNIPRLCHDLVSIQYCQYTSILAEAIMSGYGDLDHAEKDYAEVCDRLGERWPGVNLGNLNAIVREYRAAHLLEELIDSLAGMSVVSEHSSAGHNHPCGRSETQ